MLFAGAVHPHGSIVRPIIIHTVCICQFMGGGGGGGGGAGGGGGGGGGGGAPRTGGGGGPPRPPPPPKPRAAARPPPRGGKTGPAGFGGPAAGPGARTHRKLFPHKLPPTGKNTRQGRPHRVMLSRYSVISPAPARICGSPPLSSRRAPGRYASRFRGNCW